MKLINGLLRPERVVHRAWKAMGVASLKTRVDYDLFDRPHYAYCLYNAARLAAALGLPRISAVEFGVAGGNGLICLEEYAALVEKEFDVTIEIYGFDTGTGLPAPIDYRDLPYIWQEGHFEMDVEALRRKLKRAELVLGNVKDTVPGFFDAGDRAPLGAAFLDLDYWSSTADALTIFEAAQAHLLPRIYSYFDDVFSIDAEAVQCEDVGQLLAIREYNEGHDRRKLRQVAGLAQSRPLRAGWTDKIYVHHAFDHDSYATYVHPEKDRQLAL